MGVEQRFWSRRLQAWLHLHTQVPPESGLFSICISTNMHQQFQPCDLPGWDVSVHLCACSYSTGYPASVVLYCVVFHCMPLYVSYGIAWYCMIMYGCIIVGFGKWAVSRKTPIYFINICLQLSQKK